MRAQSLLFNPIRLPQRVVLRSSSATSIPLLLKLIALAIFLPEELSFYIFQFRFTLDRLILFLLTPVLLVRFAQLLASGKRRLVFSDIFIVLTGVWMIVAPALVVDLGYSLHHSAPNAAAFCGSYLATRILLSERGQALRFIDLLCHVVAIVALFGVMDALADRPIMHEFLRGLTGYAANVGSEHRWGILRAMGPMEHPILFGIACTIGLLLAVSSPIRAKGLTIAACGLGVFLSLSGAPIQAAVLGLGLLTYDSLLAEYRSRWWVLIGVAALGYGALCSVSSSPLASLFMHLPMFDTSSYWIRVYQWDTIGIIVSNSPWLGIGWDLQEVAKGMPFFVLSSVDSLWLFQAMVYGIPGAVLTGLSMLGAVCYRASGRSVNLTQHESKLATTLSISIVVIVLLGFTVDFWGTTWMLAALLVGVRAHLADLGSQRSQALGLRRASV
jgi:hypothetical protein